jgi:hypothetical protein
MISFHGKTTSNHVVFRSEELRQMPLENLMKKKNKVPCGKHSETITLFCVDCREPLCVQCMAVSHRRCENVITVTDAMTSRTDVKDIMDRLESSLPYLVNIFILSLAAWIVLDPLFRGSNLPLRIFRAL